MWYVALVLAFISGWAIGAVVAGKGLLRMINAELAEQGRPPLGMLKELKELEEDLS